MGYFSACNHYDFHLDGYAINDLAEFHAPLSGRSRDMDDDRTCIDILMKFMDHGFKSMDTRVIIFLRATTMIFV